jgi:ABC-2 type transport system ATP-binding protein
MTTHNMPEAERCDRVALMFRGRVVANAPPGALKAEVEHDVGHLFELDVDRPEAALERLVESGTEGASLFEDKVHVLCREPRLDLPKIAALLSGASVVVRGAVQKPLSMEDVFVYRVTELERAAERS